MIDNDSTTSQPVPASPGDPEDPTRKPIETGAEGGGTTTDPGATDRKPPAACDLELLLG
jgi:hypothetical protein